MARSEALGIKKLEAVHFFVNDLARGRQFWVDKLDFAFLGATEDSAAEKLGYRAEVYQAGDATYVYSTPENEYCRQEHFLCRHPDGIGELIFEVEDIDKTFAVLDERGACIVEDVQRTEGQGGSLAWFSITTPFGECRFRFVQRDGYAPALPGISMFAEPKGGNNRFGFGHIDHVTSNFLTLKPMILWMKDVMGFEEYWGIQFHTDDVAEERGASGSGLRSTVVWDPHSGVKFANNEPLRPFFEKSQIYTFIEDNNGAGIQHTALTIDDILATVPAMREADIGFMPTPGSYYDMLPARLDEMAIRARDEAIDDHHPAHADRAGPAPSVRHPAVSKHGEAARAEARNRQNQRALQGRPREEGRRHDGALAKAQGQPARGCLPVLLQMPIFFALYQTLSTSIELYHAPFIWWWTDLSSPDPYYVLPVMLGALMFVQQKLTPVQMDAAQAKVMLYAMPLMMTFFMLLLPTGLCLYMVTSSAVGITQQRYMYWKMDREPALLADSDDSRDDDDDQAVEPNEPAATKRAKPRGKKRTRRGRA